MISLRNRRTRTVDNGLIIKLATSQAAEHKYTAADKWAEMTNT